MKHCINLILATMLFAAPAFSQTHPEWKGSFKPISSAANETEADFVGPSQYHYHSILSCSFVKMQWIPGHKNVLLKQGKTVHHSQFEQAYLKIPVWDSEQAVLTTRAPGKLEDCFAQGLSLLKKASLANKLESYESGQAFLQISVVLKEVPQQDEVAQAKPSAYQTRKIWLDQSYTELEKVNSSHLLEVWLNAKDNFLDLRQEKFEAELRQGRKAQWCSFVHRFVFQKTSKHRAIPIRREPVQHTLLWIESPHGDQSFTKACQNAAEHSLKALVEKTEAEKNIGPYLFEENKAILEEEGTLKTIRARLAAYGYIAVEESHLDPAGQTWFSELPGNYKLPKHAYVRRDGAWVLEEEGNENNGQVARYANEKGFLDWHAFLYKELETFASIPRADLNLIGLEGRSANKIQTYFHLGWKTEKELVDAKKSLKSHPLH